jgi:hypothetical protein
MAPSSRSSAAERMGAEQVADVYCADVAVCALSSPDVKTL